MDATDGWFMHVQFLKYIQVILILSFGLLLPGELWAGKPAPMPGRQDPNPYPGQSAQQQNAYLRADVDVNVTGPNGAPLEGSAVVSMTKINGEFFDQKTAKNGYVRFNEVPPNEYTIRVMSPRYQSTSKQLDVRERSLAKITIEMKPLSDAEDAAASAGFYALPPKVQKEVGKALEALRANKPKDARGHLDAAQRTAPNSAEIEYLFGVYASQVNDPVQARDHWLKAIELNPKHLSALLGIGFDLLRENKAGEALPYLNRAAEAEPSSWRAHALLAEALLLEGSNDEAIKHAERAIQLGHERAATVQPVLERARAARVAKEPEMPAAVRVLQDYVQAHPEDSAAAKDLERLKKEWTNEVSNAPGAAANEMAALTKEATALPVPSNWLPPDVDDKIPPVEAGATCSVDDVVHKAGQQIMELVKDVDRFAATESLTHESINKYGLASAPEKRKFDYVVSIQEVRRGFLNVEEYRNSGGSLAEFPGGVATNGLPALVLIFHPYNTENFSMTCEGLARWNGGLAWQVHFRQRPDKPNTIKRYRIGADGPSYPVALKGRAWISADTYQIVRMETDLVSPVPQIRLVSDHTAVEYGPVKFTKGNVNMWLPQSAEVYYDWKGRRIHRRHSFSNYLLFAVDDKQKISAPKVDEAPADGAPGGGPTEKP